MAEHLTLVPTSGGAIYFRSWTELTSQEADTLATRLYGDRQVTRLLGGPFSREAIGLCLETQKKLQSAMGIEYWPIFLRSNGQFVGCCGLKLARPSPKAPLPAVTAGSFPEAAVFDLGFHLLPSAWGRGIALDAARAVLEYVCNPSGPFRARYGTNIVVTAGHHPDNAASGKLLSALGFSFTYSEYYAPTNVIGLNYALASADFEARRPKFRSPVLPPDTRRVFFCSWGSLPETDAIRFAHLLWGDVQVTRMFGGPFTAEQIRGRLADQFRNQHQLGVEYWPVFLKEGGHFVGCCGLKPGVTIQKMVPDNSTPHIFLEFGFHMLPNVWGKGVAREAATAALTLALDEAGELWRRHGRVIPRAGHHPDNSASRKLLKRLGFSPSHTEFFPPTGKIHQNYVLFREGFAASLTQNGAGINGSHL